MGNSDLRIEFSKTEFKELLTRAAAYARRKKYPQHADDFAQDAFIALANGRRATLKQLFIDFLRVEYGQSGIRSSDSSRTKQAVRRARSLDAPCKGEDSRPLHDFIHDPRSEPGALRCDRWDGVVLRADQERIVELLRDGFDQADIAAIFGISASRISQRLRRVRTELKRQEGITEAMDIYRLDHEASKLVVTWIEI